MSTTTTTCPHCGALAKDRTLQQRAGRQKALAECHRELVSPQLEEAGRRLRFLRESMDLTQIDVARAARTSVVGVQRAEVGTQTDICFTMAISNALGVHFAGMFSTPETWEKIVARKTPFFAQHRTVLLAKIATP